MYTRIFESGGKMEIKRDVYLDRLIRKEKNGLIKIVTGIRRCGKSYLLFNLFHNYLLDKGVREDHIIEIALDDRSNKELRDPDNMLKYVKERIVDENTYYIILDEVQLLTEFEDVLNSFMHIRNADIYVTGSNSRFLSSDVITEFRGRGDEIRIYPLSFREYCSVYEGSAEEAWDDYFTYGGLPLILSRKTPEEKSEYLMLLFRMVYLSDIVDRHKVRNREELDELEAEMRKENKEKSEQELGDFLFAVINAARLYKLNPDNALEMTNQKFIRRFNYIEQHSIRAGKPLKDMTLEEMDALWNEAKAQEKETND